MQAPDILDEVFDDVVYDNNAQEVFKKLKVLDNDRDLLVSRWIWELIQNARGTAGSQAALEIELVLDGDHLIFRHNGASFKDREIAHLILHGSTKHDPRDIGKFGSGFITTHLISRRVQVRGSLADGRSFDFELNREGIEAAELRNSMEHSKDQFQASLGQAQQSVPAPFTTEYMYPVSAEIRPVVLKGIESLRHSAVYIFAFNPMLHRLTITTQESSLAMVKESLEPVAPNTRCMALRNDGQESSQWLVTSANEDVVAAIALDIVDGVASICLPGDVPRLFVAFPLTSTESLSIPLVINSELFIPREERDGVFLGGSDTQDNENNKRIFTAGCHRILSMISIAAEKDWLNTAAVTRLQKYVNPPSTNETWLRSQIRSMLIDGFRAAPLLHTISGKLISPRSAWVPVAQKSASSFDLWEATKLLICATDLLPRLQDQRAWDESVNSWTPFLDSPNSLDEIWTINKLSDLLEGLKSVTHVTEALVKDACAYSWINQIHDLICKADSFDSFRQRSLIPNECGSLTKISSLHKDGSIDHELKEISDLLGLQIRARLVHPEVNTPEVLAAINSLSEDQVLSEVIEFIHQQICDNQQTTNTQDASIQLFVWLAKRNRHEKLEGFPVFTLSGDNQGIIILRADATASERPLAPVEMWPEIARPFVGLFPGGVVLHSKYAEAMEDVHHWKNLASKYFLHLAPLYETESIVHDFLPDEPLSDDEKKAELRSASKLRRTEVAFLSADDRSIVDRSRNSHARALNLIHFVLDYLLTADIHAFDLETAMCTTGVEHRFFPASWLTPLRRRVWVPVGDKKSEPPSAESLAILLAREPELLKSISEERVAQFLAAIGVSPADLLLRSVGKDDPERVSLIQSLSVISTATGNNPERVKALAGAIQQDPEVLTIIEERQARQLTVRRNQELGELVEGLFVEAFSGTGLTPKRTGPGHDYRIISEAGEEEDVGQIQIDSPTGSVFVEIKATATGGARMSVKQVGEAVAHKDSYFLCVFAIADTSLDVDSFKASAKFVTDIGHQLEHLWLGFLSMQKTLDLTQKVEEGLAIEMSGQQTRFRVDQEIWGEGFNFSDVVDILKSVLSPPVT